MKKYLSICKNSFIGGLVYRMHLYFTIAGNILYIILTYFLWTSIYKNSNGTLNGMTFEQTFLYLALAASIGCLFQTFVEYDIGRNILSGNIIKDLTKPMDYQLFTLAGVIGFAFNNLLIITVPSIVIISIIAGSHIPVGINLVFFVLAVIFSFLITFAIDYIIGLFSFYTESIWGLANTKNVIVLLLSGAAIPLNFYPAAVRRVVEFLPFQAIYNTPMTILLSRDLGFSDYLYFFANQLFWIVALIALSRLFFRKAIKVVTVNGG
ncbi:ABC transporter permease [Acetivibrio cellulolyticus]|uniref:ABC transporter permease n=1 Tax=Acetivibrio cellulolyticus TaxID=35830 RepID=UPI0001E2D092|nr:ABC-2 family transporter protein [Acetivibrio cellulolyticus]